jgi:hypothetical protein
MKRRLDSRTRGILEVSTDGTVNFLHRTARDWALQPSVWQGICSKVPEDFDPYLHLLVAETQKMPDNFAYQTRDEIENVWPHVHKALWYASQVRQSPNTSLELVETLNKFDKEVDGVVSPYVGVGSTRPWLNQRKGTQVNLHWSSIQGRSSLGRKENTFLGLMAEFCVLPYIRANLPTNPNTVPSNRCVSLLENAVFGFPAVTHPTDATSPFHVECRQRIETVAFLLGKGASRKQAMLDGKLIIDEVRDNIIWMVVSDPSGYWTQIDELMSSKSVLKKALKSTFKRISCS